MHASSSTIVLLVVSAFGSEVWAQCEQAKVVSPFGPGGRFGERVDIAAGPMLISSAPGVGAATIHRKVSGTWQLEATLTGPAGSSFGSDVAIEGTTAIVGIPGSTEGGFVGAGAIEVYGDNGAGAWSLRVHVPSPALETDANFGYAVALDGNWLIVGAPGVQARKGRAYAYQLDALGMPVLKQTILNGFAFAAAGDEFGSSVDVGLPAIAIGDPNATNTFTKQGYASTYRLNAGGTSFTAVGAWTVGGSFYHIGQTVTADGDFIGAAGNTAGDGLVQGYVWNGTQYSPSLYTSVPGSSHYGKGMALSDGLLFAGAPFVTKLGIYPHGANSYWKWNGTQFVGATAFSLHVFPPETTLEYGSALAADDSLLAAGAPGDIDAGTNAGAVYTYALNKVGYKTKQLGSSPGIKGSSFTAPYLDIAGSYCDQENVYIGLATDLGATMSFLIVGVSDINLPFLGTILTPAPDLVLPIPTDASGDFVLVAPLPTGLPPGYRLSMQCFIQDAGGPQGYAATKAYEAITAQ